MPLTRVPVPITPAMLQPANPNCDRPRYSGGGVAGDWVGGQTGNDVNASTANVAVARSDSANLESNYAPRTQTAKGNLMAPPLNVGADIGLDYGAYAGLAGRTGVIAPKAPYPDATSPPAVASVTPSTGLAAGGTAVTISGTNFTGATGVTFGGTAATAVVVVNPSTITATSPAHAVGTVDVQVTTPKGVSVVAGAADNFIYT
jgi:hypothetical protein